MIEGEIALDVNGFHFCKNIEELDNYYDIRSSRIFEVEAYGDISCEEVRYDEDAVQLIRVSSGRDDVYVAEGIQLVRELSKEEIRDYFKENQQSLMANKYPYIRAAVAKQGYGLDVLVHDWNPDVRKTVARQGYGLDSLIYDEDYNVRAAVAGQGYGLDILIHDKVWYVRAIVAKQGYGLDILLHDENIYVRQAVDKQGYGLDILVNDDNYNVSATAKMRARYSSNVHIIQ